MPTINQLPTLDTLEPSTQVPTYSVENGDARTFSLSTLTAYMQETVFEGAATAAVSTGTGTVKMASANSSNSAGWLEISPGKWVPYWSDPTP